MYFIADLIAPEWTMSANSVHGNCYKKFVNDAYSKTVPSLQRVVQ